MAQLHDLLASGTAIAEIAEFLDGLSCAQRRATVEALHASDLQKLYQIAEGRHVDSDFFVPTAVADGVEVIHHGRNSLPIIGGTFRKRFARLPGRDGLLGGYNDNDGFVRKIGWFTGPGYFVVRPQGAASPDGRADTDQLFINYFEVPTGDQPPVQGWPALAPNTGFTTGLAFGKMCDYMWRVSAHVSVGSAWKAGRSVGQYFALVRED